MRSPRSFGIVVAFVVFVARAFAAEDGPPPNIILIVTDDQGYGDFSAHGNPVLKTPHLDRLRSESARFNDFQVSPTCAPTRSALLTGRHEFKNGVTHTILERERLVLTATTLAEVLREGGYTTGIFGKWHLGDEDAYQPDRRGFDEVFIHGGGGIGQIYPGSCGDAPGNTYFNPAIRHNGKFEKTEGFCTDVFFAQAQRWIDQVRKKSAFFAYIATNAPHAPYTARPEDAGLYRDKTPDEATANFFGMVHNIDENVGRLLAKIDEWGLTRDTLIVFLNDNGGTAGVKVFNAGMRAQKGTAYMGGVRAANFWRWPGRIEPADISALTAHIDIFPTLAELTGLRLSDDVRRQIEGRSLVPLLRDPSSPWLGRTLFTHVGRWPRFSDPAAAKYNGCAVRTPRWHLVSARGGAEPAWELYDITADPGERTDLAETNADTVAQLASAYDAWWNSVQSSFVNEKAIGPKLNPFKAAYWAQFGGGPTDEELRIMEPHQLAAPGGEGKGKAKKAGKAKAKEN